MPEAAAVKADAIEIRLGGRAAQSVLPPSRHPEGMVYEWTTPPGAVAVAPFPAQLMLRKGSQCHAYA